MAGWFKEEQTNNIQQPSIRQPIKDYDELIETYNIMMKKIDTFINEANQVQYPDTTELFGDDPESPTPQGLIGEIRRQLKNSPLMRTELGRMTWDATKRMENLGAWNARYAQQLESYLDGLRFTNESAFGMIDELRKRLDELTLMKKNYEDILDTTVSRNTIRQVPKVKPKISKFQQYQPPEEDIEVPPEMIENNIEEHKQEQSVSGPVTLNEQQKERLRRMYENCPNQFHFVCLLNPKTKEGRLINDVERRYLKELNQELQRFRKKPENSGEDFGNKKKLDYSPEDNLFSVNLPENPPKNGMLDEELGDIEGDNEERGVDQP